MAIERRIVFDTNALVSYFLIADSVTAKAVQRATHEAILLASEATLEELAEVLSRRKFDSYASLDDRKNFVSLIAATVEWIPITATIRACRDPKDDKFLEVAVNGTADLIVTGDKDLLTLNPFHGIPIVTPGTVFEELNSARFRTPAHHQSNITLPDWPLSMVWKPST